MLSSAGITAIAAQSVSIALTPKRSATALSKKPESSKLITVPLMPRLSTYAEA